MSKETMFGTAFNPTGFWLISNLITKTAKMYVEYRFRVAGTDLSGFGNQ